MKLYILLLLLFSISYVKSVEYLKPGLFMSAGFDLIEGGSIPLINEKVKNPIFVQSFNKLKTYKPAGRPDLEFIIPDNISLYPLSNHKINKSSSLYNEVHSYISYEAHGYYFGVSINLGEIGIGAKYSEKYNHIRSQFSEKFKYASLGSYESSSIKMINPPYIIPGVMDENFVQVINLLPREFNTLEDLKMVKILIDYYGQFYLIEGIFGGAIKYSTFLSKEIVESKDIEWTERQLELSFRYKLFNISGGEVDEKGSIKIDSQFKMLTNDQLYFTGGFRNLQTNATLREWDRSVDDNPELIGGKFNLISTLIMNDPIKSKNLEWILTNYCNTGKLELPRKLLRRNSIKRLIPGFNVIGSGYDPITKQIKTTIFDNYQFNGKTWTNPIYKNISFEVPDTLIAINDPESYEMNYTSISYSRSEFEKNIEKYTSSSSCSIWGCDRESSYYHQYVKYFEEHNKFIITQMRRISWYKLVIAPELILNMNKYLMPGIELLINSLGTNYSDPHTKYLYDETVKLFGPEIITGTRMGGGVWMHLLVNKNIFNYMYIEDIIRDSESTFLGVFHEGEHWEQHMAQRTRVFVSMSDVEIAYDGGYWNNIKTDIAPKPWPEYKLTIKENPSPLEYETVPLHMIIKDPIKKSIMKQAINNYYDSLK